MLIYLLGFFSGVERVEHTYAVLQELKLSLLTATLTAKQLSLHCTYGTNDNLETINL